MSTVISAQPASGPAQSAADEDALVIAGRRFASRLILGTGKYRDFDEMHQALSAARTEIVTVALRRIELNPAAGQPNLLATLAQKGYLLLPNTAGCYTAEEAIRTCRLARELGMTQMCKLEVIGDPRTLFPDVEQTLAAARILVKEGFTVLPYITDDPVACQRLADLGCAAVMPLAAPIGSGLGIRNPYNLRIILETVKVPVIVDAGVGTASDAAIAMELGCHAVLMNTGIAGAQKPVQMALAMRLGVEAGRQAYLAGRIPRQLYANASSPQSNLIE